jgi:hypothetical protein
VLPSRRLRLVVPFLAAAVALPLSAAAASAGPASAAPAPFRDAVLTSSGVRKLAAVAIWGGTYTASTGEHVKIQVSDQYPQEQSVPQHWADFLASLLHGPELQTVTLYLATFPEVQRICGDQALACYSGSQQMIVTTPDQVSPDISPESVVMHEYGHHVAASRNDAPWAAIDYGTKRWSSYVGVCAKTRAHQLFPGDEQANYQLNPGEAFAETYRVLNEHRLGEMESPWDAVSNTLYPDATALSLLSDDVTTPWTGDTSSTTSVRLTSRAKTRTVSFATPLDGTLRVTVRGAGNARVSLALLIGNSRAAQTVASGAVTRSVSATVCGTRSYAARLTLQRGSGSFRLTIAHP